MTIRKNFNCFNGNLKREIIEAYLNTFCKANSADGTELNGRIKWISNICESYEEAYAYLNGLDEETYPQVAIRYVLSGDKLQWLVKTQFEEKASIEMDKKTILRFLDELMSDLRTTIPEALIDDTWKEKRRALQIAMNVLQSADEEIISKAL